MKCLFWREVLEPRAVDIYCVFAKRKYGVANITNTVGNHFSQRVPDGESVQIYLLASCLVYKFAFILLPSKRWAKNTFSVFHLECWTECSAKLPILTKYVYILHPFRAQFSTVFQHKRGQKVLRLSGNILYRKLSIVVSGCWLCSTNVIIKSGNKCSVA